MTTWKYKHLFGPVLSRRLGRSLGVDLMPFKTCTYDCVYCEQGRTTNHTHERDEYIPADRILEELKDFIASYPPPDYVTLSGAGEPTLHSRLAEIVEGAKSLLTDVPLAVITNGSLLWDGTVRDSLRNVDVVLPSLDAGNAHLFECIDHPVAAISFEQMITGLIAFRESFHNKIWLEVLLLEGMTSGESQVREIAEWVRLIRPDRVQLNTVVRPPSEPFALPVSRERLESLANLFEPHAEVVAGYVGDNVENGASPDATRVLELIERRPCPASEIAAALGLRVVEVSKLLEHLMASNRVVEKRLAGNRFYTAIHDSDERTAK